MAVSQEFGNKPIVFLAHSFTSRDAALVAAVKRTVRGAGLTLVTGQAAEAKRVSEKIRKRIDSANLFVALLTHRHRILEDRWTTSPWVIEEKAYSYGSNDKRPIILLVELGIAIPDEIGGLHGDLEYVLFERVRFDLARAKLVEMIRSLVKEARQINVTAD